MWNLIGHGGRARSLNFSDNPEPGPLESSDCEVFYQIITAKTGSAESPRTAGGRWRIRLRRTRARQSENTRGIG